MIDSIYLVSLILSLIINIVFFIPAYIFKTDKFTDFSYGFSFIFVSIFIYLNYSYNSFGLILLLMIAIWAIRLSFFLLQRILRTKSDGRFDKLRNNFFKFLGFWIIQAISVWLILMPYISVWAKEININPWFFSIGFLVWLTGLIIESISDHQKFVFKNNDLNKGQWIQSGLWKYSRHPNYFGEILIWIGIYICTISITNQISNLIGIISPIYIFVILRYFSGIPILENKYNERYKANSEYQIYKKRTNLLILGRNKSSST